MKTLLFAGVAALFATPAIAQDARPAAGANIFVSSDSDGTDVFKGGIDFDLARWSRTRYHGLTVERAHFAPGNSDVEETETRVYGRIGREVGDWELAAKVGTDGEEVLGSLSAVHDVPLRKEFFLEREIVETPQGILLDLMSTYGGVAIDVPLGDRAGLTLLGGLQDFSGDNERYHLRANAYYVVAPEAGLSLQLRTRYFTDTVVREFDYYAPGEFAQILPVVQLQRFTDGWRYRVAGGWGAQRDSDTDWRDARYAEARVTSPDLGRFSLEGSAIYSTTPARQGQIDDYSYGALNLSANVRF